jgi:hypothetical protein
VSTDRTGTSYKSTTGRHRATRRRT